MKLNLNEIKLFFADQPDIEFAVLFGSSASNKMSPLSDLDIAVFFNTDLNNLEMGNRQIEITAELMELLHINRIDIVILNIANPFLRYQVIKNGQLICSKDIKKYYHFKASSLSIYQERKPLYDLYNNSSEKKLRQGLNG